MCGVPDQALGLHAGRAARASAACCSAANSGGVRVQHEAGSGGAGALRHAGVVPSAPACREGCPVVGGRQQGRQRPASGRGPAQILDPKPCKRTDVRPTGVPAGGQEVNRDGMPCDVSSSLRMQRMHMGQGPAAPASGLGSRELSAGCRRSNTSMIRRTKGCPGSTPVRRPRVEAHEARQQSQAAQAMAAVRQSLPITRFRCCCACQHPTAALTAGRRPALQHLL